MQVEVHWVGDRIITDHIIRPIAVGMCLHQQQARKMLLCVSQLKHKQQDILKVAQQQILKVAHILRVIISQEQQQNKPIIEVLKKVRITGQAQQVVAHQAIKGQHNRGQVRIADLQVLEVEVTVLRQEHRQKVTLLRQEAVQVTEVRGRVLQEEVTQAEVLVEAVLVEVVVQQLEVLRVEVVLQVADVKS